MKIDKTSPKHWLYLIIFSANVMVGIACRWIIGGRPNHLVLYGHKLNGNLKALYCYLKDTFVESIDVSYLVLDPVYGSQLKSTGTNILSGLRLQDVIRVCRSSCIVSDHGPHTLYFLQAMTSVRFVDVWHGIPFKGFDSADFRWLHGYDATLVTSPSMKRMYEEKFGFAPDQVKITGYARTDALVNRAYQQQEVLDDIGISRGHRKIVLLAPTWSHGDRTHSDIPFGMAPDAFFLHMNDAAEQSNSLIVFRAHLNIKRRILEESSNIRFISLSAYPDTEALLYVADVLVSDWSSIVFDFLLLDRPTIFIDTPAPFAKGFSYGPEFRFGPIVKDIHELTKTIVRGCKHPDEILGAHGEHMQRVKNEVYNHYADGKAVERYVNEIEALLSNR